MKFLLRMSLVAGVWGMMVALANGQESLKDALYEAARDAEKSFDEAYAQASAAGVESHFLIEAKVINLLSTGNMPVLYGELDNLSSVKDQLDYGMDKPFHSKRQLVGLVASLRAIQAYEANDIEGFEAQAAISFVNAPEYNQAFGLLQLMTQIRQQEVQDAAMANLRVPMDLPITSVEGETRPLREWLAGNQAMLIDFWASWCGPCIQLMPELRAKAASLPDQGVFVAGMNTDSENPLQKAKQVRDQQQMQSVPWLMEPESRPLSQLLMINSIPRMVLVGPDGKVLYNGHPMDPELKTALGKLNVKL